MDYSRLRPSQKEDVKFLLNTDACMLANGMRTGKTVSTLAAIDSLNQWPVFIVSKSGLLNHWEKHLAEWLPNKTVKSLTNSKTFLQDLETDAQIFLLPFSKLRQHSRHAYYSGLNPSQRSTYLKNREPKALNTLEPSLIVVDECHAVIQPSSQITRALWAFRENSARIWVLSGTPLTNYLDDIWSYLRLFDPKKWSSKTRFRKRYINGYHNHFKQFIVEGLNPETRPELINLLDPLMRRVTRSDIGSKENNNFSICDVPLHPKAAEQFTKLQKSGYLQIGEAFHIMDSPAVKHLRLRQLSSGYLTVDTDHRIRLVVDESAPKMVALKNLMKENAKSVVVCAFQATAKTAQKILDCDIIDGSVSADEKHEAAERFQKDGTVQSIVVTYGAGGEGINLSAASTMIRLERSYSLVDYKQMQDRIIQLNDPNTNFFVDIVADGGIDGNIGEKIGGKVLHIKELVDYDQ